jgi:integrase
MKVFKRPKSDFYQFKIIHNGKLYQKSTKVANKKEAENIAAAFRTKLIRGEMGILEKEPAPTLREFEQTFINFVQTRHAHKPETMRFYLHRMKRLLAWDPWRNTRLSNIDEPLIEKYVGMRRKQVGVAAVNRELATLRRVLHLAKEWKLIQATPKVRLLAGEKSRTFVLDLETEERYLAACPPLLRTVATILVDSGLRLGEAMALQWGDIHEPDKLGQYGWIEVRQGKSANAKRSVPMSPRVYEMLTERKKTAKSPKWIFPAHRGDQPMNGTSIAHIHAEVCRPYVTEKGKRVQKPIFSTEFVLHSLRHTFLTRFGASGADAFTIMKVAGHSSVTISQRYIHPTNGTLQLAFEKMLNSSAKSSEKASEDQQDTLSDTPNSEAA